MRNLLFLARKMIKRRGKGVRHAKRLQKQALYHLMMAQHFRQKSLVLQTLLLRNLENSRVRSIWKVVIFRNNVRGNLCIDYCVFTG